MKKLNVFYSNLMVNTTDMDRSTSKSPLKPKLVYEAISKGRYKDYIEEHVVVPLEKEEFYIAHAERYVDAFFKGENPLATTNMIPWSENLANSVRYTNGSLCSAIDFAVNNPGSFSLSPTSGFHHAKPERGMGFCTFSGQIIASLKAYKQYGARGAYFDLDGHYGNSIGDSLYFIPEVMDAIKYNINPKGKDEQYLKSLKKSINVVVEEIKRGKLDYVVWCHGADSHEDDDFVTNEAIVNTECWLEASKMFFDTIADLHKNGFTIPVVSCLFGGYRNNNYDFVIDLHRRDIELGIEKLCLI